MTWAWSCRRSPSTTCSPTPTSSTTPTSSSGSMRSTATTPSTSSPAQVQQPLPTCSACSSQCCAYLIWSCGATIHFVSLVCRHAPLFFGTQLFGGLGCCLRYCVGLAGFRQLDAQAVLLTDRACCRDQLLDPFSRLSGSRLVAGVHADGGLCAGDGAEDEQVEVPLRGGVPGGGRGARRSQKLLPAALPVDQGRLHAAIAFLPAFRLHMQRTLHTGGSLHPCHSSVVAGFLKMLGGLCRSGILFVARVRCFHQPSFRDSLGCPQQVQRAILWV